MSVDEFDLEAEMYRAQAAQARVDALNALPRDQQIRHLAGRLDRAGHPEAARTLRLQGTPGLHGHLHALENDVIDLLHTDDQRRFRSPT